MEDFIENVRATLLKKRPSYQTTNKKEVRVRCPYCGDSKSDRSAAHLYIEMRPPFRFHCFKCETSGVLNNQVFRDLEVYDTEANLSVIAATKEYGKNSGIAKISRTKKSLIFNIYDTQCALNSINYFNNRFQFNYSLDEAIPKFKLVASAYEFCRDNNLYVPPGQFDLSRSIGFVSADNSHIIFRDISGQQPRRYFNLNLCQSEENSTISKTYNIPVEIDVLQPEVNLVITEGIFDIIGVSEHFYPNHQNTIFSAANGKGFNSVVLNYLHEGFLNLNISIYSDADVTLDFYRRLKESSPFLKGTNLNIYYNALYKPGTKENKDFGMPKNQISLKKFSI